MRGFENRHSHISTTFESNWDLVSSVCVQRKPMLTKTLSDFESQYSDLVNRIEFEMSYRSDHEIRVFKDKLVAEEVKKQDTFIDRDQIIVQTAQEFEDECNEEFNSFKLGNRVTTQDLQKDVKSTNRQLNESLLLIVKQNIGKQPIWILPQNVRREGETMRQTAERVLSEVCGSKLKAKFLGNAPCGYYKFKYPKSANKSKTGMKIFFFKAQLLSGNVSEEVCKDFKWLPYKELDVLPQEYLRSVRAFLM